MYSKIWTTQEFKAYVKSTTECLQNQSMCHSSSNIITMTYKMIMTWVRILFSKTRNLVLVHSAWICSADAWIRTVLDPRCKMKSKQKSILLLKILSSHYLGSERTDQRWPNGNPWIYLSTASIVFPGTIIIHLFIWPLQGDCKTKYNILKNWMLHSDNSCNILRFLHYQFITNTIWMYLLPNCPLSCI